MAKVLSFKNFDKRIQYIKELTQVSPESDESKTIINTLLSEIEEDNSFLEERLKYATNENIDLLLFLFKKTEHSINDKLYKEVAANLCLTKYVREKVAKYTNKKLEQEEKTQQIFIPNDDQKRESLNHMLQIAQFGQKFTADLIKELTDAPQEQIADMIHYIGNFDDHRTFLLLIEFYNQCNDYIKELCLEYLAYKQNAYVLRFYKDEYEKNQINTLIDEIILGYNMVYYSLISTS